MSSDAPTNLGLTYECLLEMSSLAEKAAREARESACMSRQVKMGIEQAKTSLVAAGAGVLAQIQAGNAKVFQAGDPRSPEMQLVAQLDGLVRQHVQNLINIGMELKRLTGAT